MATVLADTKGLVLMPRRTRRWVWGGRAAAAATVAGLTVWLFAVGLGKATAVAGPVAAVIALAGLFAPYLLPAYQPPAAPREPAPVHPGQHGAGGVVVIADHGSVAAQTIENVTVNAPRPGPDGREGQA